MNKLGLTYDELIINNQKAKNEYRGKYAHRYITDKVAQWVSDDIGFKVSTIIDNYINEEAMRLMLEKDSRIGNLEQLLQENTEEMRQLRLVNTLNNEKLDKQKEIIEEQKIKIDKMLENSEKQMKDSAELISYAKDTNKKLEKTNKKLNNIEGLLHEMKSDFVPTKGWNVFCMFKIDEDSFTMMRCLSNQLKKNIKARKLSRDDMVFRMETPNSVEFFSTFRSNAKYNSKIRMKGNHVKLDVEFEEFMEMLMEHKERTQQIIDSTLNENKE